MLPKTIRFQAKNNTGVAFGASDTIKLTGKYAEFTLSTGVPDFTTEATIFNGTTDGNSLASGAVISSSAIDTSATDTKMALQFDGLLIVSISTATPAGNLDVYMQESPDAGTTWPDDGTGVWVGSINFTATGTKKANVSV